MSNGAVRWLKGLFGLNSPSGPVPWQGDPQFECWSCRAVLPRAGATCPACGEPAPKH
ncbi:MAG TPA: hypothetical protein VNC22_21660 [Sporichthya sp.]|nr:hypothetical protein [Sporichthya sp.]